MLNLLNRLSPREKKILYVVIALVLVIAGYHGVWKPVQSKFIELDDNIFALQLKIRKAKTFLRQKDQIMEQSENFANLESMDAGTDEEEIARMLNFIEQTARKTTVSLSDVKPQQVRSDKWSKQFIVELNAESGVHQLVEFVHQMQYSTEMLKIERVDMSPKEEGSRVMRTFLVVTRVVVK